jgi:hypothetical protein
VIVLKGIRLSLDDKEVNTRFESGWDFDLTQFLKDMAGELKGSQRP